MSISGDRMTLFVSHNPAETEGLAEAWGRAAQFGWIIGLTGDLGAGKTQLVKGLARGLGVRERVHSPTFALINQYLSGRLPLYHLDLYRLDTVYQIHSAGLEEYLIHPPGVTVVEWAERWPGFAADSGLNYRLVKMESVSDFERRISYEDFGA
jgi:tRNA threonylcarbamoyladenosine biosynthesis protein TsaE